MHSFTILPISFNLPPVWVITHRLATPQRAYNAETPNGAVGLNAPLEIPDISDLVYVQRVIQHDLPAVVCANISSVGTVIAPLMTKVALRWPSNCQRYLPKRGGPQGFYTIWESYVCQNGCYLVSIIISYTATLFSLILPPCHASYVRNCVQCR